MSPVIHYSRVSLSSGEGVLDLWVQISGGVEAPHGSLLLLAGKWVGAGAE